MGGGAAATSGPTTTATARCPIWVRDRRRRGRKRLCPLPTALYGAGHSAREALIRPSLAKSAGCEVFPRTEPLHADYLQFRVRRVYKRENPKSESVKESLRFAGLLIGLGSCPRQWVIPLVGDDVAAGRAHTSPAVIWLRSNQNLMGLRGPLSDLRPLRRVLPTADGSSQSMKMG